MTQENNKTNEEKKSEPKKLEITQVQIFPFNRTDLGRNFKGLATITIEDQFVIKGLRIVDGVNGLFVGYPCDPFFKGEENGEKQFRNLCFPITREPPRTHRKQGARQVPGRKPGDVQLISTVKPQGPSAKVGGLFLLRNILPRENEGVQNSELPALLRF